MPRIAPQAAPSQRQPRVVDEDHKGFISKLGCVICGTRPVEVAHIRYSSALYRKENPGAGAKPSDLWVLPLCPEHHRLGKGAQHHGNEREWWDRLQAHRGRRAVNSTTRTSPLALCMILKYRCSPDVAAAERVLEQWRAG
jgi:hypothetical protein